MTFVNIRNSIEVKTINIRIGVPNFDFDFMFFVLFSHVGWPMRSCFLMEYGLNLFVFSFFILFMVRPQILV